VSYLNLNQKNMQSQKKFPLRCRCFACNVNNKQASSAKATLQVHVHVMCVFSQYVGNYNALLLSV